MQMSCICTCSLLFTCSSPCAFLIPSCQVHVLHPRSTCSSSVFSLYEAVSPLLCPLHEPELCVLLLLLLCGGYLFMSTSFKSANILCSLPSSRRPSHGVFDGTIDWSIKRTIWLQYTFTIDRSCVCLLCVTHSLLRCGCRSAILQSLCPDCRTCTRGKEARKG